MGDLPLELLSLTTKTLSDARLLELRSQLHTAQKSLEITWEITYVRNKCNLNINTHNINIFVCFNLYKSIYTDIQTMKYALQKNEHARIEFWCDNGEYRELNTENGIVRLTLYTAPLTLNMDTFISIILPPKCVEELITTLLSIYSY